MKAKITLGKILWLWLFLIIAVAGCASLTKKESAAVEPPEDSSYDRVGDEWFNDYNDETDWEKMVYWRCVVPVSSNNIKKTVSILKSKSIIPLSMQETKILLENPDMEPDSLLEKAAQREDAEADRRERESKIPFFADDKRFKAWADEHRQNAATIRTLKGKTKPYLCRGLYLNEGTGRFSAYLKDSALLVRHDCLGNRSVPMKKHPVIVFLEREPKTVYIIVTMAE